MYKFADRDAAVSDEKMAHAGDELRDFEEMLVSFKSVRGKMPR